MQVMGVNLAKIVASLWIQLLFEFSLFLSDLSATEF